MRNIENELDELVYEQYGDKLDAKDKEIENKNTIIKNNEKEIKTKDNTIEKYAKLIKKLQAFDDFNTPEARKIINALILLK